MTDTNKVDVEPCAWMLPSGEGYDSAFRDHSTVTTCTGNPWTGWIPLVPASALAALKQQLDATSDAYNAMVPSLQEQRDTLRTQLAEAQAELAEWQHTNRIDALYRQLEAAQAEAARYRNALVGMMACTLRADVPADLHDAAEKALKGDV